MIKYLILSLISVTVLSCGGNGSSVTGEPEQSSELILGHANHVSNILFAHGYHDSNIAWDTYVDYIHDSYPDWKTYRTSVTYNESIEQRGGELAHYIASLDNVSDDSLIAVGHSMGGLDLRYVVTMGNSRQAFPDDEFYMAARKIHKVYTIASPHGGDMFGGLGGSYSPLDNGAISLGIEQMQQFNITHPYSSMSVDGRKISLLAFRFHCGDTRLSDGGGALEPSSDTDSDGTVAVQRQILFGAPFTQSVFHGRHTENFPNMCSTDIMETEHKLDILDGILTNKQYYTDVKDIVFYDGNNCTGEEKGAFSSRHKNGSVKCSSAGICENDSAKSVKLYAGLQADTAIALYDNADHHHLDDWTRIHVGEELEQDYCINTLEPENALLVEELGNGITMTYHEMNGLDGKVSGLNVGTSSEQYDPYNIVFYDDYNCEGGIAGGFRSSESITRDCTDSPECRNDAAKSVLIYKGAKDTHVYVYNDPDGDTDQQWGRLVIGDTVTGNICINDLETSHNPDSATLGYEWHDNSGFCVINCGIAGNVSRIRVVPQ